MEMPLGLEIPKSTKSSLYTGLSESFAPSTGCSRDRRICIVGKLGNSSDLIEAAKSFGVPVVFSETGLEYLKDDAFETFYILEEFNGPVYEKIHRGTQKILGPTALKEYAMKREGLLDNTRPLYCQSMCGLVICFTGFRRKEDLSKLISLIHHMGGSIRKDLGSKVTHLIANCCGGDKYQYALTFRVPIMSEAWVHHCWERRIEPGLLADHDDMMSLRLKTFHGARVCFLGFAEDEKRHMEEVLVQNGGTPTDVEDTTCSHVVVDGGDTYSLLKANLFNPQACIFSSPSPAQPPPSVFLTPARPSVCRQSTPGPTSHCGSVPCSPSTQRQSLSAHHHPQTPTAYHHRLRMEGSSSRLHTPVVDELSTSIMPESLPAKAHIVRAEWFWASVQNEGCAQERDYLFEEYLESVSSPNAAAAAVPESTPSNSLSSRLRKRKRLREVVSRLTSPVPEGFTSPPCLSPHNVVDGAGGSAGEGGRKRRSSVSDAALLSMSGGSFLDCTASPDVSHNEDFVPVESPRKAMSPRQQVFMELVQTESNYVSILHTIMTLFKDPLEKELQSGKPLLNNTELKIIFGNFPPIYDVHKLMLDELIWKANHWKEDYSIGKIILNYAPELLKAYPPYVNFFENMKEMLCKCDETKPRFHAFLKVCQTKPECGRQSLQELLIRPVQRLPSISLLLNDILKHTSKSNPDHALLEKALSAIREVMTLINEDKRKTEGQMVIFDIFNEIDHCPPHLVSSHRNFVKRCEVMELSDGLSGKGDHLILFLFSDMLEVCKKRSKAFGSMKSPSTNSLHSIRLNSVKPYKHVKLIPLSSVRKVVDIKETEDCRNVFALMCRSNQEMKERLFSFTIVEEETQKGTFLKTLCRQLANTVCRADAENFLTSLDPHNLDISTSDVVVGTLGKAFKFASRTRMKVGRAFSFNKTPTKLKRAVSSMMSPFNSSTTNLQSPSSQLGQMRLASCNNLTELGAPSNSEGTFAPISVLPSRKVKSSSLNVATLRRL
ncbi:protein ECT2 isoform X2 [Ischnura elegans]|uniref:protein ECT2 isoform X2 n=1 Tax=Ischnura elegans TaxID=197161 RepID=UPI001ED8A3CE|nr:protein ECT2 isoform X2 [Ischnura elegans]